MTNAPISEIERKLEELVEEHDLAPDVAVKQLICDGEGVKYVWTIAEDLYPEHFEDSPDPPVIA